jgi:hypothetical protein
LSGHASGIGEQFRDVASHQKVAVHETLTNPENPHSAGTRNRENENSVDFKRIAFPGIELR